METRSWSISTCEPDGSSGAIGRCRPRLAAALRAEPGGVKLAALRHIAWTRSFWEAMRPFSAGGGHPNFLEGDEPKERVAVYFGREKYERLRALKRTWDPENVFHRNKNISP